MESTGTLHQDLLQCCSTETLLIMIMIIIIPSYHLHGRKLEGLKESWEGRLYQKWKLAMGSSWIKNMNFQECFKMLVWEFFLDSWSSKWHCLEVFQNGFWFWFKILHCFLAISFLCISCSHLLPFVYTGRSFCGRSSDYCFSGASCWVLHSPQHEQQSDGECLGSFSASMCCYNIVQVLIH